MRSSPDDTYTLRLGSADELFEAPPADPWKDGLRSQAGLEEVVEELAGRRLPKHLRLVLELPDEEAGRRGTEEIKAAVARYADDRRTRHRRTLRSLRHEGRRTLLVGGLLFLVGVYWSTVFLEHHVPEVLRELLGNGIFLVVAWVGLWYPLDLLVFGRRPIAREVRCLDLLAGAEIEVRAQDA